MRFIPSTSITLLFLAAGALHAAPATITLTNGKVFEKAEVVSQSAEYVTLRFAGGMAQVEKRLLPEELQAKYPLNEKAVEAERDRQERERVRAETRAEQKAERRAVASNRSAATSTPASTPPTLDTLEGSLESEAKRRAAIYFRNKRYASGSEVTLTRDLLFEPMETIQGWSNRYRAKGTAWVQFWDSSSGSFAKREVRFEITLITDDRGRVRSHEVVEY